MSKKAHHLRPKYVAHAEAIARQHVSKDVAGDAVWTTVGKQYLDTLGTATTAAAVGPLLRNTAAQEAMTDAERQSLKVAAHNLSVTTRNMLNKLKQINDCHRLRTGNSENEADLQYAMVISDQYQQWVEEWQGLILPLIEAITDIFANAANLKVALNPNYENEKDDAVIVTDHQHVEIIPPGKEDLTEHSGETIYVGEDIILRAPQVGDPPLHTSGYARSVPLDGEEPALPVGITTTSTDPQEK